MLKQIIKTHPRFTRAYATCRLTFLIFAPAARHDHFLRPSADLNCASTRRIVLLLVLAALAATTTCFAQLAPANTAGVRLGHIHLYVRDVAAQQHFWTLMGGVAVKNQRLKMIQFPGVFIILRKAEPSGAPEGSIRESHRIGVERSPAAMATWKANGLRRMALLPQLGLKPIEPLRSADQRADPDQRGGHSVMIRRVADLIPVADPAVRAPSAGWPDIRVYSAPDTTGRATGPKPSLG